MGGSIKQSRAINWGHLESCHPLCCARLFASTQKYTAEGRRDCWLHPGVPSRDAEVLCVSQRCLMGVCARTPQSTSPCVGIKWWMELIRANVLS